MTPGDAHVLVVEDSGIVADALRILLESAGHRVSIAGSITEALGAGTTDPADLVLVDLTLPDGNGLSLIEPLRAMGSRVFVALTGHDDEDTRTRCLDAGCTDVAVKPVPARELVARVEGWLARARTTPASE